MFVPRIASRGIGNDDVCVRWKRQPNMHLKSNSMAMLVTGSDYLHAAPGYAVIMDFKAL
jgi:hypothetical protein